MPKRKHTIVDQLVYSGEDLNPKVWYNMAGHKLKGLGTDIKLVGVRVLGDRQWHRPTPWLQGKHHKANAKAAIAEGFVELRFSFSLLHQPGRQCDCGLHEMEGGGHAKQRLQ